MSVPESFHFFYGKFWLLLYWHKFDSSFIYIYVLIVSRLMIILVEHFCVSSVLLKKYCLL